MASIHAETVAVIEGLPQIEQERVEDLTRVGDDGTWFRRIGERGEKFQLTTTVDLADATAAQTKINTTYPALLFGASKAAGAVIDNSAKTWSNIALLSFRVLDNQSSPNPTSIVTVGPAWVLRVEWECLQID